jgi:hypothetical protein
MGTAEVQHRGKGNRGSSAPLKWEPLKWDPRKWHTRKWEPRKWDQILTNHCQNTNFIFRANSMLSLVYKVGIRSGH